MSGWHLSRQNLSWWHLSIWAIFFSTKILLRPNFFGNKHFWTNIFLDLESSSTKKLFGPKIVLDPKNVGPQNFSNPKFFCENFVRPKFFCIQNCWIQIILGHDFSGPKIFWIKIFLNQKIFGHKIFPTKFIGFFWIQHFSGPTKSFWTKLFVASKFLDPNYFYLHGLKHFLGWV